MSDEKAAPAPGPRVERLAPRQELATSVADAQGAPPLGVERLAPAAPARLNRPASSPTSQAPPRPETKIAAEVVELVFEPASLADAQVRERFERAPALALSAPDPLGKDARRLLRLPRPFWATRRRLTVELPANGPEPGFSQESETGKRADWTILLASPPRPVAFGETAPPAPDWERWIAARSPEPGIGIVRVNLRGTMIAAPAMPGLPARYLESSEMLLWGRGRAVLVASPESREAWLETAEAFAFLEAELSRLERETASCFARDAEPLAELLLPFSSEKQRTGEERHGPHAQRVGRIRREFALLEPVLADPPQELSPAARPLFDLLADNHRIELRLGALDDRIEVLEDQSEVVGERLLELGVARRELRLEWLIVIILAAELLVVGVETYYTIAGYYRDVPTRSGD